MTPEGRNGVLEKILLTVGRIEGRCDGIEQRLDRIDARLDMGSAHMRDQGQETAKHGAQLRELTANQEKQARSISALYKQVGAVENTGSVHVIEERTRWSTLKVVAAIALALFGAVGGSAWLSTIRCNNARALSPARDAAVQEARR